MFEFEVVVALVEAIGIMALTAMVYGTIVRTALSPVRKSVLVGLLFSVAAIFAMMTPVQFAPGIIIDGRGIMVGLGAAFGGLPAAIIVAVAASGARLYIGGAGALPGVAGILLAAMLGLVWIRLCPCKGRPTFHHLLIGGGVISLSFFVVFLLPYEMARPLLFGVYPIIFPAYVLTSLVLGTLIERERKLIEITRQLQAAAHTDPLTGLMNRRGLETSVRNSGVRSETAASVIVFDLDHFKAVNDSYGHEGGDRALVTFANILKQNARESDTIVRMGGEEFALLLPNTTLEQAQNVAERILQGIRTTPVRHDGGSFPVTVSAGISRFWSQETEFWQAVRHADKALYQAKRNGRDQVMHAPIPRAA